jgi:hypothetical protein
MEYSRRQVLASTAGVALSAGCIGSASSQKFRLDAGVISGVQDPFSFDVEVLQSSISRTNPGRVAVDYHNIGDEVAILGLVYKRPPPFPSESRVPGVVLLHDEKNPEQETDGCWMPERDTLGHTLGQPKVEIQPGEQVRTEFEVWADPKGKPEYSCLKPGTYRVQLPESATVSVELQDP